MTDLLVDNSTLIKTTATKMMEIQQSRTYDELRELDIEETPESLR